MAVSQHEASYNDQDIDPNSTLLIRICIENIAQTRAQALSSITESDQDDDVTARSDELLAGYNANRSKVKILYSDITQDRVTTMSADELVSLHKRVQQLELSNYDMLRRIYGDQISAAPYVQFNGHDPSTINATSEAYRERLFEHYQTMLAVARNPQMPGLEPASTEGARLLKTLQTEVARMTKTQYRPSKPKSPPASPREHRLRSQQKHGRYAWRVDKKATQAPKARFECFNAGTRTQSTALTDYQIQLIFLEEQNQKRLAMAKIQREAAPVPAFDPMLYQAQLAAPKVKNHKRPELLQDMATTNEISDDVNTEKSADADLEMSGGNSPAIETAELSRGRQRTMKLPTRDKRGR